MAGNGGGKYFLEGKMEKRGEVQRGATFGGGTADSRHNRAVVVIEYNRRENKDNQDNQVPYLTIVRINPD